MADQTIAPTAMVREITKEKYVYRSIDRSRRSCAPTKGCIKVKEIFGEFCWCMRVVTGWGSEEWLHAAAADALAW